MFGHRCILVGTSILPVLDDSHVVLVDRHDPLIKDHFHLCFRFLCVQVIRNALVIQVIIAELFVIAKLNRRPYGGPHGKPIARQRSER